MYIIYTYIIIHIYIIQKNRVHPAGYFESPAPFWGNSENHGGFPPVGGTTVPICWWVYGSQAGSTLSKASYIDYCKDWELTVTFLVNQPLD